MNNREKCPLTTFQKYYTPSANSRCPIKSSASFGFPEQFYESGWRISLCDLEQCSISSILFPCKTYVMNAIAMNYIDALYKDIFTCLYCAATVVCMHWLMGLRLRRKIRQEYCIAGSNLNDCLIHCFCSCCALNQEMYQLKYLFSSLKVSTECATDSDDTLHSVQSFTIEDVFNTKKKKNEVSSIQSKEKWCDFRGNYLGFP